MLAYYNAFMRAIRLVESRSHKQKEHGKDRFTRHRLLVV